MVWVACSISLITVGQTADADPVSRLLEEYGKFSTSGLSDSERIARYKEWRQMLTMVVRANPASESKRDALREVVRISNALGDSDQSLQLLEELLDDESISLWERYELQMQHAAILRMGLLADTIQSGETCERVIASYIKANDLIDQLLRDTSGIPARIVLDKDGSRHVIPPFDRLSEQKIINFARSGQVLLVFSDSKNLSLSSANYFRQAREKLIAWGTPRANLQNTDIDLEYLASKEALAAAYAGDMQNTEKALMFLDTLKNKRWATSFYVDDIAHRAFLDKGKNPREFLIKWIEQNEDDERTCILISRITDSFFNERPTGYLDLALPYLESLVDGKYAEPLMKIDGTGISQGNSGNYAMALSNIVEVHKTNENYDKAILYNNRLLEMFPNYGGLTASARIDASILATRKETKDFGLMIDRSIANPWTPVKVMRVVTFMIGTILCMCILYLMYRKYMKK